MQVVKYVTGDMVYQYFVIYKIINPFSFKPIFGGKKEKKNFNPLTTTWRSERHFPPSHWRRLDVAYVKSVKIGVRGFYIMRAGMKEDNTVNWMWFCCMGWRVWL